jgi:hypothetical protein
VIRVEWGKSRYKEEIKVVQEEMDRTLRFFVWKAADWHGKGTAPRTAPISAEYAEGLKAYAERQASLCQSLHNAFKMQWQGIPSLIKSANEEIDKPNLFYRRKQQEFEKRKAKPNPKLTASSIPLPTVTIPKSTNEPPLV